MNDVPGPVFRRCPTCGRYYSQDESTTEVCSDTCRIRYERCTVCGRYFPQHEGAGTAICSEECAKVYVPATGEQTTYVLTEETV